jgi:hypothetical protein
MISVDEIVLPDACVTSCGQTAKMLNQDINFDNPILIYNNYRCKRNLHIDDLKQIDELLIQYNKLVLEIDVAGWFDHVFTLYNTNEGIYVVESYIHQKAPEKHRFDLDKLYQMLIDVSKYIGVGDRESTSTQRFDECAKIWYGFWNARHITGASGNLDYYTIQYYHP